MINNEGPSQVAHTRSQAMRLTIGYLTPAIHDASQPQWAGVVDAAKKHGVNLICVPGQSLHYPQEFSTPANILYELVNAQNVDGVISWASSIGNYVNDDELRTFHTRYHPLPVVTLGRRVDDNIPYLVMDSYVGMREAIVHLIQVHGYRRLVFIRGPENHLYAQERYRAYTDTLEAYGIPLDPELVSPYCYWESHFGAEAMRLLLDERGLRPQLDFEAIVSANDHLLLGVLETLQSRGIRVPGEVAVVGFDDITLARTSMPPFTSVAAPFYEMGHRAVEMLLAMIEGERVPMKTTVPAKLVVRQSCGCLDPAVVQAAAVAAVDGDRRDRSSRTVSQPDFKTILAARRKDILDKMVQAAGMPIEGQALAWAGQLLDALCGTLSGEATRTFLSTLDDILRQVRVANGDVSAWQNVLSALRHQALPYLEDKEALQIEDLWGQARVLTGEAAQRAQAHQTLQAIQQAQALREISLSLIVAFDIKELMDVLAQGLPRLGMPSCYLSLYENPQAYQYPQSIPAWSRLALAYNEQGCAELEGQAFPSRQLVPRELWSQKGSRSDRPRSFVVEPLYFQKDQIGLVLFEVGPREGTVYDALRGQISSALKGALLVQQVQERSAALVRQQYILDTFMANVPDSIYFKDRDSRITHANPAHARGLGLQDVADEIGKTDFDFFPEEQARIKYELEQEIIHTGQPILAMEEPCAQRRWVLTTKMPLRDEKGEIVGTFGISRDITELKRMQETLEKANVEISTLNERLKAENVRMEAELDVTRRLQQMLLPTEDELRQIEGMDIAGFMQPADEVGGDYYDVLQHNGALKIGIGDVTGHGLESGVVMLMLQTAVRTLQTSGVEDPVYFMDILNRLLHANLQRMNVDKSMTLTLLDYHMGRLRLSGQHEQLIVMRRGGKVQLIDTIDLGFPLGIEGGIARFVKEMPPVELEPGDGVVLYSDGITEAENEAKEFYGLERLCQVVSAHWDEPAEAIKDAAVADVRKFIGKQKIYDDLTLLVAKQK